MAAPSTATKAPLEPSSTPSSTEPAREGGRRPDTAPSRSRVRALALGGLFAVTIGVAVWAATSGQVDATTIQEQVDGSGWRGALTFIGVTVLLQLLWMPRSWGVLAAAALFGPWQGIGMSMVADTISAIICYVIARWLGRRWVEGLLEKRPRARRVIRILARRRGGVTLGLLRCTPLAHYTLTSYAAGMAAIPPIRGLIGNTIGLIPGAAVYAIAGATVMDPGSPWFIAAIGSVVAAGVLSVFVGRMILRRIDPPEPLSPSGDGE